MYLRNIPVYLLKDSSRPRPGASALQTEENRFMLIKTSMINMVLAYGYNVLYSDIDVMLFMNPLRNIPNKEDSHLLSENVKGEYGTGFMYITSSDPAIALFNTIYESLQWYPDKTDKTILNVLIANKTFSSLKAKKLGTKFFQEGIEYYKTRQFFGDIYRVRCRVLLRRSELPGDGAQQPRAGTEQQDLPVQRDACCRLGGERLLLGCEQPLHHCKSHRRWVWAWRVRCSSESGNRD